ncbi:MAG: hypothetical protein Q7J31_07165 [Syntrophales bacterium]|nr:hypothetical protein [Syntrophales bacterium]
MEVKFGRKVFIRNVGKDEYWLQDMIYDNPSILGLGDVKLLNREKSQSSGGRLDILLKDHQDNTMYEVEVMLGETDPSHIIRSIEYWDNEKRKYPQRQHFSVLIAESFERRYFNVIQILSMNIPMIAIQADLLEVNKEYILNFNKILDVYAEPEDSEEATTVNESSWNEKSSWTLNTAKELFSLVETDKKSINYTQSYISIVINGRNSYNLDKRTQPTSILWFNVKDDEKVDAIKMVFDNNNVVYNYNRYKDFVINVDQNMIKSKKDMFQEIIKIRHKEIFSNE